MNEPFDEQRIVATIRSMAPADPLPDVDVGALVRRERVRLRRRRIATSLAAAGAVAAVTLAAVMVPVGPARPDRGDGAPAGPASSSSTATRADPPTEDERLLAACGRRLRTDLRGWRVVVKDAEPGYLTAIRAINPAKTRTASCSLPGPELERLRIGLSPSANAVRPVSPPPRQVMFEDPPPVRPDLRIARRMMENGIQTCTSPQLRDCVGWLHTDSGRLPLHVARIHVVTPNGRTKDIPVVDGYYVTAWGDRSPVHRQPVTWTLYDARGKVLGSDTN